MENHTGIELNNNSKKILVVEDDILQQMVMSHTLQTLGYELDITDKGREAVKLANANEYDFILMDLSLPDIKGYEAIKLIRKNEVKYLNPPRPIAIFTASIVAAQLKDCFEAGANWVFIKPLVVTMLDLIENHLEQISPFSPSKKP